MKVPAQRCSTDPSATTLWNLTRFFLRVTLPTKQGEGHHGWRDSDSGAAQRGGLSRGWSERGEIVKISSFGSFAVRHKGQRIGRNPKTGQEVPISPRRVLVFRASHALKDQINQGLADAAAGATHTVPAAKAPSA